MKYFANHTLGQTTHFTYTFFNEEDLFYYNDNYVAYVDVKSFRYISNSTINSF
jgi:hypothetical protein